MTFAKITPGGSPFTEAPDERDEHGRPATDALKAAEARRLEMMELERAADEGMTPPSPDTEEGSRLEGSPPRT